ncbi:MAG: tyrosine-type recombinase/integrase [bacterium]|nr:tyrosine-type recombinase/integrase [bacterium]
MAAIQLTESHIKALRPRRKTRDIRDASIRGLGIRVYPTGRKRFFVHTQHQGQRIWKIIGDASEISLNEARKRAQASLNAVRGGKPRLPDEATFETVAEEVFRRYGRTWKRGTLKANQGYYRRQILPWFQGRQITDITAADVWDWFASLHATPFAADRSVPVLSVIMARAEDYGYRPQGSNPCKGIRRYRRQGRERFCSVDEVCRLGHALHCYESRFPAHVAIIRLLLLTGCRSQEIMSLRWKEYRQGHLHLTDTKTGPRMVWLSSPARRILDGLPRRSPWVFPSRSTHSHIPSTVVFKTWCRIRAAAGLSDVRLHDLRHTYASLAIMHGENILTVGRLLGHKDPATTLSYTHVAESQVVESVETIGAILGRATP